MKVPVSLKQRLINFFRDLVIYDETRIKNWIKKNITDKEWAMDYNAQWPNPDRDDEEKVLSWIKISPPEKVRCWYFRHKDAGHFFEKLIYDQAMDKVMRGYDDQLIEFVNGLPPRMVSKFIEVMKNSNIHISKRLWAACMERKYSERNDYLKGVFDSWDVGKVRKLYSDIRENYYWNYLDAEVKEGIKERLGLVDEDELRVYFN